MTCVRALGPSRVPPAHEASTHSIAEVVEGVESDEDQPAPSAVDDRGIITDAAFEDVYNIGPKIGEGAYSTVFSCTHKETGKVFAVKLVRIPQLKKKDLEGLKEEVRVMQQLRHKNIVRLEQVFRTKSTVHIVAEMCSGGELFDQIIQKVVYMCACFRSSHCGVLTYGLVRLQLNQNHYTEREAQSVVRTLARGIAYCHAKNIVHRDLKVRSLACPYVLGLLPHDGARSRRTSCCQSPRRRVSSPSSRSRTGGLLVPLPLTA